VLQAAESTVKSLDAARRRALSPIEPFKTLEPFETLEPFDGGAERETVKSLDAARRRALSPEEGNSWFINSQTRPLHASEEDETRRQGSNVEPFGTFEPFETLEPFSVLEPLAGGALEPFGGGAERETTGYEPWERDVQSARGGAGRRLLGSSSSYRIRTRRMLITQVNAATYGVLSARTVPANADMRQANADIRQANADIRQADVDIRQANSDTAISSV